MFEMRNDGFAATGTFVLSNYLDIFGAALPPDNIAANNDTKGIELNETII